MSCARCGPDPKAELVALSLKESRPDQLEGSQEGVEPTILLVGNPNVGKSTVFNALTGARQTVMNAPGTTVEVMVGRWAREGARILDLPGTYSLVAQSPDEESVVDTLAGAPGSFTDPAGGRSVDLVVCVLDATAVTRSLYLLGQVARTGRPLVALLTHQDIAQDDGNPVDPAALSEALGVPVMAANPKNPKETKQIEEFISAGLKARPRVQGIPPDPTAPGYNQVAAAAALAATKCDLPVSLAGKRDCHCTVSGVCAHVPIDSTEALAPRSAADDAAQIFSWVESVENELGRAEEDARHMSRSDRIDRVLLNPYLGIPIFFMVMWLLFMLSGDAVGPIMDFFDSLFADTSPGAFSLANLFQAGFAAIGLSGSWIEGFFVGGLSTGLGVVASFVPLMFIIFLLISLLEDSGYMARAAFLGDRVMRWLGLDGRVILPLIMGFGCNLPALAAVRSLPSRRQRLVTVLITPYTSCAARLTIYLMIARIFFPGHAGTVIFAMYLLSILMVVLGALVLKPFFTAKEAAAPLMLVLPPYGVPRALSTLHSTWLRTWSFVKGAGKIIVAMTVVVWLLGAIPTSSDHRFADPELPMSESVYGKVAEGITPIFKPAGFGEWHLTGALMTGFVAKETVISSIVVSYNLDPSAAGDAEDGGDDLGRLPELIHGSFTEAAGDAAPLGAFAFLIFVLTYTPCLATVAEQIRQIGARMSLAAMAVQLSVAWLLAVGVFQIGRLFL